MSNAHRLHAALLVIVMAVVAVGLIPGRAGAVAEEPPAVAVVGWRAPVEGEPVGLASDGHDVAVLAADEVRLLDGASGALRWRVPVVDAYDARPALGPSRVAVSGDGTVTLLDRATGTVVSRTRFPDPGAVALGRDARGTEVVVVASETERHAGLIDAATGARRWTVRFPAETWVAPGITAGTVVVAGEARGGTLLRGLDAATGATRWQARLGPDASAPLVVDGTIYLGSGSGRDLPRIEARDARTGRVRWSTPFPGSLGAAIEPAVWGDHLLVLDALGTLGSFSRADGAEEWYQPTGHDVIMTRLAVGGGRVVWTTFLDEVVVVDAGSGDVVDAWRPHGVPIDAVATPAGVVQALRLAEPARVEGLAIS